MGRKAMEWRGGRMEGARPRRWIEKGWEILGAKGVNKVR